MSGMIVFLIGVSNIMGWVMAFTQIPQAIAQGLLGLTSNPVLILLIMNLILLIAGCNPGDPDLYPTVFTRG